MNQEEIVLGMQQLQQSNAAMAELLQQVGRRLEKIEEKARGTTESQEQNVRQDEEMNQDWEEDWDEDENAKEKEVSWLNVLRTGALQPSSADSVALAKLLGEAPPLGQLKASTQGIRQFQGVPQTPTPRKNKIDFHLFQAQKKLEDAMHMQMNFMESNEKRDISLMAA